jgi:hypothetical protein
MEKEDKIAFSIISLAICGILFAILWGIKFIGSTVFGLFAETETAGMGFKDAYPYGIGLSIFLIIIFAIFAGDGIVGELPTMILGFFLFSVFFTFSIAWLY